jgi:hypothetical protein
MRLSAGKWCGNGLGEPLFQRGWDGISWFGRKWRWRWRWRLKWRARQGKGMDRD